MAENLEAEKKRTEKPQCGRVSVLEIEENYVISCYIFTLPTVTERADDDVPEIAPGFLSSSVVRVRACECAFWQARMAPSI